VRSIDPDNPPRRARLRARLAAACAAGRARLRAERGSMLIEVMVGAFVLGVAAVAILNGIDGAQSIGAANKARSVEATLAQQDIERMRALPLASLDNLRQTRPVNVAGVDYSVVSRTDWVSDQTGTVNCSDTRAQAEYLKLTSTVTAPGTSTRPVTETALLTPGVAQLGGNTGSATVLLVDRAGVPLPGVGVNLTGASPQSATTNSLGCAVFGLIPAGSYTVAVNGYVDVLSQPATDAMQVYAGRGSFNAMQVDRPTTIRANFVPPSGQTITTSMVWDRITVKNANLLGGKKLFVRTAGRNTSVDGPDLYPYTDGVGVYAGECAANDPSTYVPNYFVPTAPRGFTSLTAGEALRSLNVEMPTLRVQVTRQTVSSAVPSWTRTQLLVTSLDTGCTTVAHQLQNDRTNSNATVTYNVAQPFGRYRICAATRGRTSGTSGTTGATIIDRRYTTTTTAGASPTNPANQSLIPPTTANRSITITVPSASTAAGMCF
jgi:Tfp pilus assembly protein PilV